MDAGKQRGIVSPMFVGIVMVAIVAIGLGWRLGRGEQATARAAMAEAALDSIVAASHKAKQERDALDTKYSEINLALKGKLDASTAATARTRVAIQSAVAANPSLRDAAMPADAVGMFNAIGTAGGDGNPAERAGRADRRPSAGSAAPRKRSP
jgi:hypothetical protein